MSETRADKSYLLSFRAQIDLLFIVGIVLIVLISSITTALMAGKVAKDHFIDESMAIAKGASNQSRLSFLYGSEDSAQEVVRNFNAYPSLQNLILIDKQGRVLTQSQDMEGIRLPTADEMNMLSEVTEPVLWHESDDVIEILSPVTILNDESDDPFQEVEDSAEEDFLGVVSLVMDKHSLKKIQETILVNNLLIAGIISALIILVLFFLTQKITNPLSVLSQSMKRISKGEKNITVPVKGALEVKNISLAFNQMISDLSAREEELESARDAALASVKAKEEFTASITHEIRTPINGVYGALQLLEEMKPTHAQREYIRLAMESSELLLTVVNDILDFSKLSANRMPLEKIEFNLSKTVENIIALQANVENSQHLVMTCFFDKTMPERFFGDPKRIQQILNNLVSNAIKFTKKGHIRVFVRALSGQYEQGEDGKSWITIAVEDSGIGIPKKEQGRMFDAYSQQDASTSRKYGGTGLGLAICQHLVGLMGGKIHLESEEGAGSTFYVDLPLEVASVANKPEKFVWDAHKFSLITLANNEDEKRMVGNLCDRLSIPFYHYEDIEAYNASQLTSTSSDSIPKEVGGNIILWMNPLSGAKQAEMLKALSKRENISVLLCVRERKSISPDLVFDEMIRKPIRIEELKTVLKKMTLKVIEMEKNNQQDKLKEAEIKSDQFVKSIENQNEGIGHLQVLVVEDNPVNQRLAKAILKSLGMAVKMAENGSEAVKCFKSNKFDIVLMDCQMPIMNGYEATEEIRSYEKNIGAHQTPIIAISANSQSENIERCKVSGMNDFISKPYKKDTLNDKINNWIACG